MSKTITVGQTEDGKPFNIDVNRLIVSRALITASSGGGKSWLMRKLLEELSATTQTLVIDPEGEFSTLREVRDMLLVGGDGDLPADPRSAGLLCRRLMELNVSAVLDIYELTPAARREFVANFLTEMVNLPKSLWRNCFVVIDEAHEFAPNSTDKKHISRDAVGLLFSKGRKRGFCPIIATQRFAKLSMDVAAEARNRFVGLQNQDVDQRRAADSLGWDKSKWTQLRDLSPPGSEGEFFAYGPALMERDIVKFRAGKVKSTHPHAGDGSIPEPPQPSKKIAGVLSELQDLPQKAAEEIRNLDSALKRIAELERDVRNAAAASASPARPAGVTTAFVTSPEHKREIATLRAALETAMKMLKKVHEHQSAAVGLDPELVRKLVESTVDQLLKAAAGTAARQQADLARLKREVSQTLERLQRIVGIADVAAEPPIASKDSAVHRAPVRTAEIISESSPDEEPMSVTEGLTRPQQKILDVIKMLGVRGITADRESIAAWLDLHPRGGSYGDNLKALRTAGFLDEFRLTDQGAASANDLKTGPEAAMKAVPTAPCRKILKAVMDAGPISRDELAASLGLHPRGGSFGENLSQLRTMGLINSDRSKPIEVLPALHK